MRIALFFHKPVMLYAQGIGPVLGSKERRAVRDVLQRVTVIGVRDADSKAELAALGVTVPPVHVTADAVLSMHPVDKQIGFYLLKKAGVTGIRRRIGIAVRDWKGMEGFKREIAKAADTLQKTYDARIIFIPMQYPADVRAGEDIAKMMTTESVVLKGQYNTVEFMSLIGCMDAVIANRLHALVFAAIMQIPAASISYDPKIDSFIHLTGDTLCGTVETITAQQLVKDISGKLEAGQIAPEVKAHLNHLRRQSMRNAYLALRVIEGKTELREHLKDDV